MQIHFDADTSDWLRAFANVEARIANATPAHEEIGDFLTAEAVGNIDRDGGAVRWPPLKPETLRRHPRPGDKMLVVTGRLRGSMTKDVHPDYVDVGSSVEYARTQFYGRRPVPKRTPFAWLSGTMQRVGEIYIRWLIGGLR